MQSTFDPTTLKDMEYTGDLNTRLTPVPEGEFWARLSKVDLRQNKAKDGRDLTLADFLFIIEDDGVKQATHLLEPQVRMSIFLDIGANGALLTAEDNPNANVKLGRIKAALGIKPGKRWSFRHMEGQSCYVKVKQRTDPEDIEIVYSDVVSVSKEPSRKAA